MTNREKLTQDESFLVEFIRTLDITDPDFSSIPTRISNEYCQNGCPKVNGEIDCCEPFHSGCVKTWLDKEYDGWLEPHKLN